MRGVASVKDILYSAGFLVWVEIGWCLLYELVKRMEGWERFRENGGVDRVLEGDNGCGERVEMDTHARDLACPLI